MPERPPLEWHVHPGQQEPPPFDQLVQVVPVPTRGTLRIAPSQSSRSSPVVIFTLRSSPATTSTACPARSASRASSVASPSSGRDINVSSSSRRNPCGVCASQISSRGIVSSNGRGAGTDVLDGVAGGHGRNRRAGAFGALEHAADHVSVTNGRAASCTTMAIRGGSTRKPSTHRVLPPPPPATKVHGRQVQHRASRPFVDQLRWQDHDEPMFDREAVEGVDAPLRDRAPAEVQQLFRHGPHRTACRGRQQR